MRFLQCQKNTMTIGLTLDFTGSNLDFFILQRTKNRGSRNKMVKKMPILFFSREETRCGNREIREKKRKIKSGCYIQTRALSPPHATLEGRLCRDNSNNTREDCH